MISFPNCKINLGLGVLRKREDGYHDIQTVFYPLPLHDAIEVIQAEKDSFSVSGIPVEETSSNLCMKALQLLQQDFTIPPVHLHLHKRIPMGAGLGGGSADGAYTLLLLNDKFSLGLTKDQLATYALQLGSDCPFFIYNQPCLAGGRGEALEMLTLDLSAYKLVVVHPGIHVSTAWAFSQLQPRSDRPSLHEIIQLPVAEWKGRLYNDFEVPVSAKHPEIAAIRDQLYEGGAVYAAMSGSGSSVFGLFRGEVPRFAFPALYFKKTLSLRLS